MIDKKIFSDRFRELRKSGNVTMVDIAEALGLRKQSIHQWDSQKTIPTADKLLELADYFNVSLDYLVGRSDNPERR
jgi:transcriptional regulator with XRE-family HTH domain